MKYIPTICHSKGEDPGLKTAVCVCVCVYVRARVYTYMHLYAYVHTYMMYTHNTQKHRCSFLLYTILTFEATLKSQSKKMVVLLENSKPSEMATSKQETRN